LVSLKELTTLTHVSWHICHWFAVFMHVKINFTFEISATGHFNDFMQKNS
jgi:hypothetical protein